MHDNLPDIPISSTDTKLERVDRVWMDAVERHSAILQLGLTQSEMLPGIHLLERLSITVESLNFEVAQFSWNVWVPLIHKLTSSTN